MKTLAEIDQRLWEIMCELGQLKYLTGRYSTEMLLKEYHSLIFQRDTFHDSDTTKLCKVAQMLDK